MKLVLLAMLLAALGPWAAAQTTSEAAAAPAPKAAPAKAAPAKRSATAPPAQPAAAAPAEERTDRADLDRTQITGSRELPKVLYIVPWKKPAPGALAGRPVQSVLDEALAPVDRDVFRREIQYDAQLRPPPAAAPTAKP